MQIILWIAVILILPPFMANVIASAYADDSIKITTQ